MKFGICNEIFQEWDNFERTCDFVKDVGYDGIEIAPFTFADDIHDITPETRAGIAKTAAEVGLDIIGLHWLLVGPEGLHVTCPDEAVRERTSAYLVDLVNLCAELGGTRI